MITAIEVNHNSPEPSAVNTSKKIVSYSKAAGQWVLKKACQKKDYTYRSTIMNTILQNVKDNNKVIIDLSGYIRRPIPQNIAPRDVPKPKLEDMLLKSRF